MKLKPGDRVTWGARGAGTIIEVTDPRVAEEWGPISLSETTSTNVWVWLDEPHQEGKHSWQNPWRQYALIEPSEKAIEEARRSIEAAIQRANPNIGPEPPHAKFSGGDVTPLERIKAAHISAHKLWIDDALNKHHLLDFLSKEARESLAWEMAGAVQKEYAEKRDHYPGRAARNALDKHALSGVLGVDWRISVTEIIDNFYYDLETP